jgi:hypothetical protein
MTKSWSRTRGEEEVSASTVVRRDILHETAGVHEGTQKGNVATMKEVSLSTCPSEEEWDAEAATTFEDDGAYFVEDLTEGETPSNSIEEEDEEEEKSGMQKVASPWR